jgi:hypothetical protein
MQTAYVLLAGLNGGRSLRHTLCLLLVALALGLSGCTGETLSRTQLAESAATGVVAAIARGDKAEVEARFGAGVPDELKSIPASFGPDPKMYSATFTGMDPESSNAAEVVVVMDRVVPTNSTEIKVALEWNPKKHLGDWDVVSVGVLYP